jgi:hypothetical protein
MINLFNRKPRTAPELIKTICPISPIAASRMDMSQFSFSPIALYSHLIVKYANEFYVAFVLDISEDCQRMDMLVNIGDGTWVEHSLTRRCVLEQYILGNTLITHKLSSKGIWHKIRYNVTLAESQVIRFQYDKEAA